MQQPHVGRLETRPPNIEGRGEIRQRELVKNALRMRPDRIIVGEVRGEEAFDMLQAMTTGHEGSMTTVHANSPRDAIARLEQMVGMAGFPMTENSIRSQIASAIKIVVQLQRFADGKRRVTSISEITGLDGGVVLMQEIFKLLRTKAGSLEFRATGLRPSFLEALELNGGGFPGGHVSPRSSVVTGVGVDFGNLLSFGGATVLVLLFCAHFLVLEAIFLSYGRRSASRSQLKRRLATETDAQEQEVALTRTRQKRGLSANGEHLLPLAWLNRLIMQSGVTWGVAGFPAVFMGVSTAVSLLVLFLTNNLVIAVTAGLLLGGGLGAVVSQVHARSPAPQAAGPAA